jgi:hypothetical protein
MEQQRHASMTHLSAESGFQSPGRYSLVAFLLLLTTGLVGCDGNRLRPVVGTVIVDGKPAMTGVEVVFIPQGNTREATGLVAEDGKVVMKTVGKPGAMAGLYKVVLRNSLDSIRKEPAPTSEPTDDTKRMLAPMGWAERLAKETKFLDNPPKGPGWIPKSYDSPATSPLQHAVPKGGLKSGSQEGLRPRFEVSSESDATADAPK